VPAAWFLDGSLLDNLAAENLAVCRADGEGGGPLAMSEVTLTWGSICSGSEAVLFVLDAISKAYQKLGVIVRFIHQSSCEIKTSVQAWIRRLHQLTPAQNNSCGETAFGLEGCLVENAACMGCEYSKCLIHGPRLQRLLQDES